MSSPSLVIHAGGWKATQADLESVQVPDKTDTYYPVPYGNSLRVITAYIKESGYSVTREQYALNKKGNQMFGVIDISGGNKEEGWALGIRNSYDKSISFGLCGGLRTFVCDNLAFSGDIIYTHKHTKNVSLVNALDYLFKPKGEGESALLYHSLNERLKYIEHLKVLAMTFEQASYWTIGALRAGIINNRDVVKVMQECVAPTHREMNSYVGTTYGWLSAITYVLQDYSASRQMTSQTRLANLMTLFHSKGNPGMDKIFGPFQVNA